MDMTSSRESLLIPGYNRALQTGIEFLVELELSLDTIATEWCHVGLDWTVQG